MLILLLVIITLGIILEIVSLSRNPDVLELDFMLSSPVTEPGAAFTTQAIITNSSRMPLSYAAFREICPKEADLGNTPYRERLDGLQMKKVCRVGARRRVKMIQEISVKKRGVYSFRVESVEIGDFLGFRELTKSVFFKRELVVYPDKPDCPRLVDTIGRFLGDVTTRRFLLRDSMLTAGYREYTGREPMRDIHWLQSARQNTLMVREYEYTGQLSVSVILALSGTGQAAAGELDECCAVARTVCETLLDMKVSVCFFTNAVLKNKGLTGFWKCEVPEKNRSGLLEGLGRVCEYTYGSADGLIDYARRSGSPESAFILIMAGGDKTRGAELESRLKRATGSEVILIDAAKEVCDGKDI